MCSGPAVKVMAWGLPMKMCDDDDDDVSCACLFGFWSTLYVNFCSPIEGFFSGHFTFMHYSGSYIEALICYLFHDHD